MTAGRYSVEKSWTKVRQDCVRKKWKMRSDDSLVE